MIIGCASGMYVHTQSAGVSDPCAAIRGWPLSASCAPVTSCRRRRFGHPNTSDVLGVNATRQSGGAISPEALGQVTTPDVRTGGAWGTPRAKRALVGRPGPMRTPSLERGLIIGAEMRGRVPAGGGGALTICAGGGGEGLGLGPILRSASPMVVDLGKR